MSSLLEYLNNIMGRPLTVSPSSLGSPKVFSTMVHQSRKGSLHFEWPNGLLQGDDAFHKLRELLMSPSNRYTRDRFLDELEEVSAELSPDEIEHALRLAHTLP